MDNNTNQLQSDNSANSAEVRPYKYNDKTVKKLIEAFNNSYNISEACQYARIDRNTFYFWLDKVPGFADIVEEAKAMPLRKAKEVITKAIVSGDVNTAKWYAERRDPDFKPKAEVDNNIGLQETRKKLGDILDDRSSDDFGEQSSSPAQPEDRDEISQTPSDIS